MRCRGKWEEAEDRGEEGGARRGDKMIEIEEQMKKMKVRRGARG